MTDSYRRGLAGWPLLFCLLLPLVGCARFHPRPIDPAASARLLQQRTLHDPRLLRFLRADLRLPPGPVRWNLPALTAAAVYERPDLRIAEARVQAAEGGETTAAALPNPVLGLSPTYNGTMTAPSPWTVGPVVTELLRTAGKRPAAIQQARARASVARQQLRIAAWTVRAQVRAAFIRLWGADRRATLTSRYADAARRMATLVAQRFQAGMVSAATLTNQRVTETRAALALAAAERDRRLARAELAAAVGVPARALDGLRIDFAALDRIVPPGPIHGLRQTALTSRPSVLAALARYQEAQAALRLAIAGQYPDLTIGPGYHYDQGDNKFILALSLPLPVFNQNQGPIAVARANRQLAAARFEQVQTRVLGQIDTAWADWDASRHEVLRTHQLLQLAQRTVRSDAAAFRAGAIGSLRLTGARLAMAQTELGALPARINERTALGRLEDALHRPIITAETR